MSRRAAARLESSREDRTLGLGFWVGLAYILCILSALSCVIYGIGAWNKGDEPAKTEDVERVKEEDKAEKAL